MPSGLCMAALTMVSSAPSPVGIQVLAVALGGVSVGEREGRGLRFVGLVMGWPASQTVTQAGACLFPGLCEASGAVSALRAFP